MLQDSPDRALGLVLTAVDATLEAANELLRVAAELAESNWDVVAVAEITRSCQVAGRKAHYATRLHETLASGHGTDLSIRD